MEQVAQPKTLQQAIKIFSDESVCIAAVAAERWPDGKPECPKCSHKEHYWLATQRRWKCKECGKQFSVKVGTIMEDSALPLTAWLPAMWLLANCRNGVSSYEVGRALGITQKSAWFMLHRIRLAMQLKGGGKLSGGIEVDETFIGGKARNMHARVRKAKNITPGGGGKTIVMGVLKRGGEVRTEVIPNREAVTLQPIVHEHVRKGSKVFTDEHGGYLGLDENFAHAVINHAEAYVDGMIHTNGMENFWSLFKRCIGGTYVSVEPFHLFRYLDEQEFRFNNRHDRDRRDRYGRPVKRTDAERFQIALGQIDGKRLTYEKLTGKEGSVAEAF